MTSWGCNNSKCTWKISGVT